MAACQLVEKWTYWPRVRSLSPSLLWVWALRAAHAVAAHSGPVARRRDRPVADLDQWRRVDKPRKGRSRGWRAVSRGGYWLVQFVRRGACERYQYRKRHCMYCDSHYPHRLTLVYHSRAAEVTRSSTSAPPRTARSTASALPPSPRPTNSAMHSRPSQVHAHTPLASRLRVRPRRPRAMALHSYSSPVQTRSEPVAPTPSGSGSCAPVREACRPFRSRAPVDPASSPRPPTPPSSARLAAARPAPPPPPPPSP